MVTLAPFIPDSWRKKKMKMWTKRVALVSNFKEKYIVMNLGAVLFHKELSFAALGETIVMKM